MTDFEAMYYRLYNRITDAIRILQQAQQEAEQAFIDGETASLIALNIADEE